MVSDKIALIIGLIFSVIVIGGGSYLVYQRFNEEPVIESPLSPKKDVIYSGNSLYKNWTEEQARAHCDAEGGKLNPCGSACLDPSQPCIQVCAMRCEFLKDDENINETQRPSNPENPDISSWQTYRNEKYELEVEYPKDHSISFFPQDDSTTKLNPEFEFQLNSWDDVLLIKVYYLNGANNARDWVSQYANFFASFIFETSPNWADSFLANITSVAFSQFDGGGRSVFHVWGEKNGKIYYLSGNISVENLQILSTSKIIE